jgi:hypothetical protein
MLTASPQQVLVLCLDWQLASRTMLWEAAGPAEARHPAHLQVSRLLHCASTMLTIDSPGVPA